MLTDKTIIVEALTETENKVYCLNGIGKQTKEIADIMKSSYETAKSHMKNIKVKLGLQKDKEVTAHFWCNLVGENLDEVKRQIIASVFLVIFIITVPVDFDTKRCERFRLSNRQTTLYRRNDYTA